MIDSSWRRGLGQWSCQPVMRTWNGRMFLLVSFLAFSRWGFSESQIAEPIDRRCCIVGGVRRVSVLLCLDYVIAPHFSECAMMS